MLIHVLPAMPPTPPVLSLSQLLVMATGAKHNFATWMGSFQSTGKLYKQREKGTNTQRETGHREKAVFLTEYCNLVIQLHFLSLNFKK